MTTLNKTEVELATYVGMKRATSSLLQGHQHAGNITRADPAYDYHIRGAMAEMAAAKALGCYWPGAWDTYGRDGDIIGRGGQKIEVRYRSADHYDLLLKEDDCPDRPYVLVTGTPPIFNVVGWIWGRDGMMDEFWKQVTDRPPSYFVPQSRLRGFNKV